MRVSEPARRPRLLRPLARSVPGAALKANRAEEAAARMEAAGQGRVRRDSVHTAELEPYIDIGADTLPSGHGEPELDDARKTSPRSRAAQLKEALAMETGSGGHTPYSYHQADAERAAHGPQSHPTSAALYSIWRRADVDGNG